jgi:hypothetical protein
MINFRPKNWNLRDRLLATVAFFDVFDMPIKIDYIRRMILGDNNFDEKELYKIIESCSEKLEMSHGYIYLVGRKEMVNKASVGTSNSEKLIKKANKKLWIFDFVPFIDFIALCNYLPLGIAEKNSDIDLLVVAKHGRIFTVRLFLTIISQIAGMRRYAEKIEGRFCLSFYVDQQYLDFKELLISPYDIYFAYWMIGMLPLYGERESCFGMREENKDWLDEYFENINTRYFENHISERKRKLSSRIIERLLRGKFGKWFESRLASYFIGRHKKNSKALSGDASVEVNSKRLKFHNNDKRRFFTEEFEKRLKRLGTFQ